MSFNWALHYPDLQLICKTFGLYDLDDPDKYCYKVLKSLTQQGPQCGIVALVMCAEETSREMVEKVLNYAKEEGMTNVGEMFSVDYMYNLALKYLPNKVEIFTGSLEDNQIVDFLYQGGSMLVPYDCDKNHTPMKNNGKSAHWAIVFGIVESYAGTFVIAKQGKSLNVHIWSLSDLAASNQQLFNYEITNGIKYVMPEGGMGGSKGLCNRSLLIHHKENDKIFTSEQ